MSAPKSRRLGLWLTAGAIALAGCPERPPDDNPNAVPLAPPIIMESGVINAATGGCSSPAAPTRKSMYIRQPAAAGNYPLFMFLPGTFRAHDNPTARAIVDRAAGRGFVAASIDYDTVAGLLAPEGSCNALVTKAACTFSNNDAVSPEGALRLICGNQRVDGSSAGLKADCSRGIVVAGFSQGGNVALQALDHNPNIRAAWTIGNHNQGELDPEILDCIHPDTGTPPGVRALPSEKVRMIVGQNDTVFRQPHQSHLEATTGRTCPAGTLERCFDADDSGWAIVPSAECDGECLHEYLDHPNFFDSSRWWGASQNLDWLTQFVDR